MLQRNNKFILLEKTNKFMELAVDVKRHEIP
jgi:hypothetical protein